MTPTTTLRFAYKRHGSFAIVRMFVSENGEPERFSSRFSLPSRDWLRVVEVLQVGAPCVLGPVRVEFERVEGPALAEVRHG